MKIFYLFGNFKNPKEMRLIDKLVTLDSFLLYTCTNKTETIHFKNNIVLHHIKSTSNDLKNLFQQENEIKGLKENRKDVFIYTDSLTFEKLCQLIF
jgi:hypothetical protein